MSELFNAVYEENVEKVKRLLGFDGGGGQVDNINVNITNFILI